MQDNYRASLNIESEPFFCLCYYCYYEPWTRSLAFFMILWGVGIAERMYRHYRGRRQDMRVPGEEWHLVGNELRKCE